MQTFQNLHEMEVYSCAFQIRIAEASMSIKFPCTYTVEVKSLNNKNTFATTKNKVSAINSVATFNEILHFETDVMYNPKSKQFIKKQVLILLNLISSRRPDQQKLVGRVSIDLCQSINSTLFSQLQSYKLQYCSVNASITFSAKFVGKKISSTPPENFQRDSFTDFQSFVAGVQKKQHSDIKQKSFQQPERSIQMPWKSKVGQVFQRANIIEQSLNQDLESRVNAGRTSHKTIGPSDNIVKNIHAEQSYQSSFKPALVSDSSQSSLYKQINPPRNLHSPSSSSNIEQTDNKDYSSKIRCEVMQKNIVNTQKMNQPVNQYEQILRNSHVQQKRIWEEQKRLLQQQIAREKAEINRLKQKNDLIQKKNYEAEMKICNFEGKAENSKRELMILEKEKDLEIKDLKSKIERAIKQKTQKLHLAQVKQAEAKQLRQKLRLIESEKRKNQQQINRQHSLMNEKMEAALRRVVNSQEYANKLQQELEQKYDHLNELENTNRQLKTEKQRLEQRIEKLNVLEEQVNNYRKQKLEFEKNSKKIEENIRKEYQNEKKQQLLKIKEQEQQLEENDRVLKSNLKTIEGRLNKEIENLNLKISELEAELQEKQIKEGDLALQIEMKDKKIEKINKQFSQKLMQIQQQDQEQLNQIVAQNQVQIDGLMKQMNQFEAINLQLESKLAQLELNLAQKQGQINKIHEQSKAKQMKIQGQLNQLKNKLSGKSSECIQMQKAIELMKKSIVEMKQYERGLEEELLLMHQKRNQNINEENINEKQQLQQQMINLSAKVRIYERQMQQRNNEIEDLKNDKNNNKQYIMALETQILKLNEHPTTQLGSSQKQKMEKHIAQLQEEINLKQIQNQNLRLSQIQAKQYQLSLEEQILAMNDQIDAIERAKRRSGEIGGNEKSRHNDSNSSRLERRICDLQEQIKAKNDYERELEEKILSYHEMIQKSDQKSMKQRISQLQQTIRCLRQYQQGLEQKILIDHDQIEYANQSNQLIRKLKQHEDTIKNLKQYQECLEQKILEDHDQIKKEEYLKSSIKDLEQRLKQQREYQEGLQEKILMDHEIIDKLETDTGGLKDSKYINKEDTFRLTSHQECIKDKLKLQRTIQKLEQEVLKLSQAKQVRVQYEQMFRLQKQVEEKNIYIEQLQKALKQAEQEMIFLSSKLSKLLQQKEQTGKINKFNKEDLVKQQDENNLQHFAYEAVIRVIEAHSEGSDNEKKDELKQQKYLVDKANITKSMISQPPSLKEGIQQISQDLSDKSSPRKISFDDGPDKAVMDMDLVIQQKPKGNSLRLNKLQQIRPEPPKKTSLFREVRHAESKESNLPRGLLESREGSVSHEHAADLERKLGQFGKQEQVLKTRISSLESVIKQYQKENNNLKLKVGQMQSKMIDKEITKDKREVQEKENQIKKLKRAVEDYEQRIKMMKNKEVKIEQALRIIEDQSNNIIGQLTKKQQECSNLERTIQDQRRQINFLKSRSTNQQHYKALYTQRKDQSKSIPQIQNLLMENDEKSQQISILKQKISIQSQQNKKFQQILSQMTEKEDKQKKQDDLLQKNKQRISELESQLKAVNQQLSVSKRLVSKLRQNKDVKTAGTSANSSQMNQVIEQNNRMKKRVEQLEEELFSYQSNENQKDIQIETIKTENNSLRQEIEKARSMGSKNESDKKQMSTDIEAKLRKQASDMKQKMESATNEHKKQIEEKQQKIKNFEIEIGKFQALMKAQRLEYFAKSRQINNQKQQLQKQNQRQCGLIQKMQVELNELKELYKENQERLMQVQVELEDLKVIRESQKESDKQKLQQINTLQHAIQIKQIQVSNKNKQIQELEVKLSYSNQHQKTQQESNKLQLSLHLLAQKAQELQSDRNNLKTKLQAAERIIEQLNSELELCQQQNLFANKNKEMVITEDKNQLILKQKEQQNFHLRMKLEEAIEEHRLTMERNQVVEKQYQQRIHIMDSQLRQVRSEKEKIIEELEEKQMEHMNTELDLQFKLREKNEKSQLAIGGSITDNQFRKSLNASQDVTTNDLVPASKILKQILASRSNRGLVEKQIEVMVIRITQLEQQIYSSASATKEKGLILQKTRMLSMQFSKFKVNIMRSKISSEDRIKLLTSLRPLENMIKDILKLSEIYSENLLSSDITGENSSG